MRDQTKRLEAVSAVLFTAILGIGTWAQFALPYFRGGPTPPGCYFGDALIVFISCDTSVPSWAEQIVLWAWYLTWGWFWLTAFFVPFAPMFGVPIAIIWLAVVVLAIRWVWRTVAGRLRRPARTL